MKQEKRIAYKAGITRTPSDFLCADGELAECINLTTDNEELKPMVQPAEYMTHFPGRLLYVHKDRYIYLKETGSPTSSWDVEWTDGTATGSVLSSATQLTDIKVTSIGKTLVIATGDGMGFYPWKGDGYRYLGSNVPDIGVEFSLSDPSYLSGADAYPIHYVRIPGMHGEILYTDPLLNGYVGNVWGAEDTGDRTFDSGYETGKDGLAGLVFSRLDWVKEKKRFAFPFWARSAVRLYDGTHVCISNPFLLMPTVLNNWEIFACNDNEDTPKVMDGDSGGWPLASYHPYCAKLYYKTVIPSGVDLDDWEDIISGIDIFVSEEVMSFDPNGSWTIINNCVRSGNDQALKTVDACKPEYTEKNWIPPFFTGGDHSNTWQTYYQPALLSEGEMTHRLLQKSIFYKLFELDFNEISSSSSMAQDSTDKIDRDVLKNLVNRPTLKNDDYFSRSQMIPKVIKAYNSRLHLADVMRSFFSGFTRFSYTAHTGMENRSFYVYIRTDEGTKVVMAGGTSYEISDVWFFYPDPRAFKVEVFSGSYKLYSLSLKEHPLLNGAYYFGHLPDSYGAWPYGTYAANLPTVSDDPELLEGRLMVSEVNNPWMFTSRGGITIGLGGIVGMASQTMALGQEEHGIHPMIVFSEKGISALRINNDGVYLRSDEASREVCINAASITETDGAVFFVSKKGLMVAASEGDGGRFAVRCVSERMNGAAFDTSCLAGLGEGIGASGAPTVPWATIITDCQGGKSFLDYIRDEACMMAYDYIDSRLLIINARTRTVTETVEGQAVTRTERVFRYCYVYNMADGTISKAVLPADMDNVVNDYPDYLIQSGGTVYTLYGKQREEEVLTRQTAFLLTRPMKLAGPLVVSSLRELVNVGVWDDHIPTGAQDPDSMVKTEMWVSDNLRDWYQAKSRFGAAAKYYRIGLYIKMLPTERLSGTIIMEQERRTDNKRT